MLRNNMTAAVANELAMHAEDLADSGEEVRDEGGNPVGALYVDTALGSDPHSFVVVLAGDRRLLVSVRELADGEPTCGHPGHGKDKCAHMGCRNYYTFGSPKGDADTGMTMQEQEAFEARPDFPGWDAL